LTTTSKKKKKSWKIKRNFNRETKKMKTHKKKKQIGKKSTK